MSARRAGPGDRLAVLVAGIVVGVIGVMFATSFAALVFTGPLSRHLAPAIAMNLAGQAVLLAGVAWGTSIRGSLGSIGSIPAAIVAVVGASIAAGLAVADPRAFPTVVAAIVVTSGLVGLALYALGRFGAGELIRFVPYPVLGGFMAGTGWLLLLGALAVLTGSSATLSAAADAGAERWLPGLALGALLVVLVRRSGRVVALPAALLAAVAAFYAVALAAGASLDELRDGGWLAGPFPGDGLWQPWRAVAELPDADWSLVAGELPTIATAVVVAPLALLLNATAGEQLADTDGDLDRELRTTGAANLVAGLLGAIPGHHSIAVSALAQAMTRSARPVGLVAAAVCVLALLGGTALIALLPRIVLGGLLAFVALSFFADWLVDGYRRLPLADFAIVVTILLVVATLGFLAGVAIGLAAAVMLFIVNYSRVDPVRHELSRASFQSNVDRPPRDHGLLRAHGELIQIVELQGFVFFGSAMALLDRVRRRLERGAPPRFVVVDLADVVGTDSSAGSGFARARSVAESAGAQLVITNASDDVWRNLEAGGLTVAPEHRFADLDRGIEWCEERLLAEFAGERPASGPAGPGVAAASHDVLDFDRFAAHLERVEVPAGHVVAEEGDDATDVFVVVSGRLTALVDVDGRPLRIRTMSAGTVVGEVSLYLGGARTASVVSETPCTLLRASADALRELERRDPQLAIEFHRWLAARLAERLADALRTAKALHARGSAGDG